MIASLDRNKGAKVSLPLLDKDTADKSKKMLTLDIVVEAIGRDNSGSKFDFKGLVSEDVYLNGKLQVCLWVGLWGGGEVFGGFGLGGGIFGAVGRRGALGGLNTSNTKFVPFAVLFIEPSQATVVRQPSSPIARCGVRLEDLFCSNNLC